MDPPLVRAVVHGRVLVLVLISRFERSARLVMNHCVTVSLGQDEADKAPLEVVCVLKGLIEDRYMLLADGRR
jgi:hypothetical protein